MNYENCVVWISVHTFTLAHHVWTEVHTTTTLKQVQRLLYSKNIEIFI